MYEDGPSPDGVRQAKGKGRRGSVLIAFIGVIIALIAVVFYLILTPHPADEAPVILESVPLVLSDKVLQVSQQFTEEMVSEVLMEEEPDVVEEVDGLTPKAGDGVQYHYYTVQEGDKIETIADRLGLQPSTILSVNSIKNLNMLREGTVLRYPEFDGQLYIVRSGDTADRILLQKNPDITAEELLRLNGLVEISPGDEILIPSPSKFSSPIPEGIVLYQNGDYYNGESLSGVIIEAPAGTPVLAVADGTVIDWSNNGNDGYSITLMHEDSYQTRYSYLGTLDQPSAGKKVKKGSSLGTVPEAGPVMVPSILFQLTQMGVPMDPELIVRF